MQAYCGGRRSCLLAKLDADSSVMESLARQFRNIEVVAVGADDRRAEMCRDRAEIVPSLIAVGADDRVQLMWGRGKEVGETLEDDEEVRTDAILII